MLACKSAHTSLHLTHSYGIAAEGRVEPGQFSLDANFATFHYLQRTHRIQLPNKLVQYGTHNIIIISRLVHEPVFLVPPSSIRSSNMSSSPFMSDLYIF
jgi:hypothetical protein